MRLITTAPAHHSSSDPAKRGRSPERNRQLYTRHREKPASTSEGVTVVPGLHEVTSAIVRASLINKARHKCAAGSKGTETPEVGTAGCRKPALSSQFVIRRCGQGATRSECESDTFRAVPHGPLSGAAARCRASYNTQASPAQTRQAQAFCPAARPHPRRLPHPGVILVDAQRHRRTPSPPVTLTSPPQRSLQLKAG